MEDVTIRQVIKLNEGEWYVSYTTLSPCKCRIVRDKVKIYQISKPADKTIYNAIRNKRETE